MVVLTTICIALANLELYEYDTNSILQGVLLPLCRFEEKHDGNGMGTCFFYCNDVFYSIVMESRHDSLCPHDYYPLWCLSDVALGIVLASVHNLEHHTICFETKIH